jgi:DNA-binding NarL/FixJ family response regulator
MQKKHIKVLIVDDHQLMIEGLKSLLECEEYIDLVEGSSTMEETLSFLEKNQIDVVLMDVNMPKDSGIDITLKIKKIFPEIKIIALTMHEDISIITKMMKAGASGYVLKKTNMSELVNALKTVVGDGKYLSTNVQNTILDNLINPDELMDYKDKNKPILSVRELEVLNLITKEMSNEQIGDKLFISERTVEAHRRNIFIKTKTKSIVGLIKYAINEGLISFDTEK